MMFKYSNLNQCFKKLLLITNYVQLDLIVVLNDLCYRSNQGFKPVISKNLHKRKSQFVILKHSVGITVSSMKN